MAQFKEHIMEIYNRKFQFEKEPNWILPHPDEFLQTKWNLSKFQAKKGEVNQVKSLLSNYDIDEWANHTKKRDPSSFIIGQLRSIHPELLTQAWCKFYECLSQFPLIPEKKNSIRSLHLCEAPGAFVCALNHYLALNYPSVQLTWLANTLNPYHEGNSSSEMISDDRFIKYTIDNWCFGADNTGDLTHFYNHVDLFSKVGKQSVDLVTADGSVDCMSSPGEQEEITSFLHYCEVMTALQVLRPGGNFVLKIFTIFEASTICILYLLNCLFDVSIFKPCCSKSGNSELYVICRNYRSNEIVSIIDKLLVPYREETFKNTTLFDIKSIPASFLTQLESCVNYFTDKQIHHIQENIIHFQSEKSDRFLNELKKRIATKYLEKYDLFAIPKGRKILKGRDLSHEWRNIRKYFPSSFNQFSTTEIFQYINNSSEHFIPQSNQKDGFQCNSVKFLLKDCDSNDLLDIKLGQRIESVKTSKFLIKEDLELFVECKRKSNSQLYNLVSNYLSRNNKIISLNDLNPETSISDFHKSFFYKIFHSFNSSNYIFVQIPFFTHFLVGLLYLLLSCYDEIIWHPNGILILHKINANSQNILQHFQKIDFTYKTMNHNSFTCDIIQLVSPTCFDNSPKFFKFICEYNHSIIATL